MRGRSDESERVTRPHTSVVIPTFQRRDVVTASVVALARQEGAGEFEAIVVVDGSTDGTAAALRALELPFPLMVIEQENSGRAAACNRGAAAARGDVLLFLDDDMEADARLLAEHERSRGEGADVVLGHIPLHPESPPTFLAAGVGEWAERRARVLAAREGAFELEELLSGQLSIGRDAFDAVGGFDTRFTRGGSFGGEDLDFGRRLLDAGYRVVFNANAISRQRYVVEPRQYLRQWRQNGSASVLLARKHPAELERAFHRRPSRRDRLVWRWLRTPLREVVLATVAVGSHGPRTRRWFFRVRNLEYFHGIDRAGGVPRPQPVRVLCYHAVADLRGARVLEPYGVPPAEFRRQLRHLVRHYRPIDVAEFRRFLSGAGVPRRAVLVTFDDCYADIVDVALPALRERGVPALAFAVTRLVGKTNEWDAHLGAPELRLADADGLRALADERIAIGSHARTHRMLNTLAHDELGEELRESREDIEHLGLPRPDFLAYPHGEHSADVRTAARDAGYAGAFTVTPGLAVPGSDPYTIPRLEIRRADAGWRFAWKLARGR